MIYKWLSQKGAVLGLLTVPDRLAVMLEDMGSVQFQSVECCTLESFEKWSARKPTETIDIVTIYRINSHRHRTKPGEVYVSGITPELLEAMPGFAFAPGAAYLKSILEGG